MNNKWLWIEVFSVGVVIYLIFDILDIGPLLRQIAIFPICFLEIIVGSFVRSQGLLELDTDIRGVWATCIRVLSFAIELGAVLLPGYYYTKSKKKAYLLLMLLAIAWIIIGMGFWLLALFSMFGMMD